MWWAEPENSLRFSMQLSLMADLIPDTDQKGYVLIKIKNSMLDGIIYYLLNTQKITFKQSAKETVC